MDSTLISALSLVIAFLVPTVGIVVAVARGFAKMEVRFAEFKGIISQHAVDLLRIESDLRTDLQEIRMALSEGIKDHETRLREPERRVFRGDGGK